MKSCCFKWIFTVFLLLKTTSAVDFSNLDLTNTDILEDETVLRPKRQAVDYGSGEFICGGTPNQDCYTNDDGVCFCECRENFYSEEGQGCIRGKLFGGNITFNNEYDEDNTSLVNETVKLLFNSTEDIVEVFIDSISNGSINVGYILMFRNIDSVNKDLVQNRLQTELNCSTTANTEDINGLTLNVSSSCKTVVSENDDIVCSSDFNNCDERSTTCSADSGFLLCNCNQNFYQINATTCLEQICVNNQDCNSPFGWCVDNDEVNSCTCMWGFDGLQCYQPWLFTLTVVGGGCVLIILSLIIALVVCSRKKKTKKSPKPVKDDDSVRDDEPSPRYQPSSYQLGLMRARMPSVYDRSNNPSSRNVQQMSYGENGRKSGRSNNAYDDYNGRKSGRSNNAYDDYASSTTTFNSPQRGRRYPNEYF